MAWFWFNIPLAAVFFSAWVGIPLWLVFKHPDHAAGPVAVPAPPEGFLSEPADLPVAAARELARV
jgi:hypothetical protein